MIAAVVALAAIIIAFVVFLVILLQTQQTERREWTAERRGLVDRAIASHTGEIVALDRAAQPRKDRPDHERPQAVGL